MATFLKFTQVNETFNFSVSFQHVSIYQIWKGGASVQPTYCDLFTQIKELASK